MYFYTYRMQKNLLVYNIFPTPIIHLKLSTHNNFKFNFEDIKDKDTKPENWLDSVYTSFPNVLNNDKYIKTKDLLKIKKDIKKEIDIVFKELEIPTSYSIKEFWYNVYHKNQSQESHMHLSEINKKNPYWSGVYYYSNCEPTIFLRNDINPLLQNFNKNMDSKLKHFYFTSWMPDIKDGDIILFPSYLNHKTNINKTNNKRITFSFNLYLN